jgi:predicted nucleic acid-binding protein
MAQGIARQAPGARRQELTTWLLRLEQRFAARILPVDGDVAWKWGELTAYTQSRGAQVPAADGLIAATALRHGLHVMTRNVRQFALTGTTIINPWEDEA